MELTKSSKTVGNNTSIALRYDSLHQKLDDVVVRYIWIDGNGHELRTKSRQLSVEPKTLEEVPIWTYCGQTCGHMKLTANSDCWLQPVLLCGDPFRSSGRNKCVLCVPVKYEIEASIYRHSCVALLDDNSPNNLWFTIEQPYTLLNAATKRPLGWPLNGYTAPKGPFAYGVGANKVYGRDINEAFYSACMYAGLPIAGTKAGALPATWSFEIGACSGASIGDYLWMARYFLHYIGEEFGVVVSFHNKFDAQQKLIVRMRNNANQFINPNVTEIEAPRKTIGVNELTGDNALSMDVLFASDSDPYCAVERVVRNTYMLRDNNTEKD